jgi:hypothetical protein
LRARRNRRNDQSNPEVGHNPTVVEIRSSSIVLLLLFSVVLWRGLFLHALAYALRRRLPKGARVALSALDRPWSGYELRVTT